MARTDYFGGIKNPRMAFTADEIQANIKLMVHRIETDFMDYTTHDIDITFLVLLKGGARFAFDLMNCFRSDAYYYDFIGVESYGNKTHSTGDVKFYLYKRLSPEVINDKYVIVLDDICDTGQTLKFVKTRLLTDFKPKVIRTATLIWREKSKIRPDFYAFKVKHDEFFFGYGLGIGQKCRHLSGIYTTARD